MSKKSNILLVVALAASSMTIAQAHDNCYEPEEVKKTHLEPIKSISYDELWLDDGRLNNFDENLLYSHDGDIYEVLTADGTSYAAHCSASPGHYHCWSYKEMNEKERYGSGFCENKT